MRYRLCAVFLFMLCLAESLSVLPVLPTYASGSDGGFITITNENFDGYEEELSGFFQDTYKFHTRDGSQLPEHVGTEPGEYVHYYAKFNSSSNYYAENTSVVKRVFEGTTRRFQVYLGCGYGGDGYLTCDSIEYSRTAHMLKVRKSLNYYILSFDDYAYTVRHYASRDQWGANYGFSSEWRYYYHLNDAYQYRSSYYLEYPDDPTNPDTIKEVTIDNYEKYRDILEPYMKYYRFYTEVTRSYSGGKPSYYHYGLYDTEKEPRAYSIKPLRIQNNQFLIPDFSDLTVNKRFISIERFSLDTKTGEIKYRKPGEPEENLYTMSFGSGTHLLCVLPDKINDYYYQMDNGLSSYYEDHSSEKPDNIVTVTPQNYLEYAEHLKAFMESRRFNTEEGDPLDNAAIRSFYELYEEGKTPETLDMTPLKFKGDHFEICGNVRYPAAHETDVLYLDTISDTVSFQTGDIYGSRRRLRFDEYCMILNDYNYLNNRMEESHFYYLQEDGILSSFYQKYPDHATNPKHLVTVKDVSLTTTDDSLGLVMFAARNLEVNPAEFFHVTVYDILTAFLDKQNLTYEFGANYAETHINSVSIKGPSLTITPDMEINLQYAIIRTEKGQKTCLKYGDIPRHDSIAVTPELCENSEIIFILGRDREKNLAYIKNKVNGFSPEYEDFPPPENLLTITSENYMENMDLLGPFFEKRQFHIAKGEPLTEDVTSFYEYYDPDTPPAVREESAVSFDGERFHVYLGNRYVYLRSAATSFETLELDTDTGVLSASANEKRYDLSFSGSSYHIQEHDLRTGSVVKEQYYYLQEDGVTSSFYAEYPEHPTRPGAPVEPDPDLTESQGLLLASTATVLSFSMLILNRIAQDPILSFWLACSLVGIGIYVVYRIRNAID